MCPDDELSELTLSSSQICTNEWFIVHWSSLHNAETKACRSDSLGFHSCTPISLSVAIAQVWGRDGNKTGADALAANSGTGGKVEVSQSTVWSYSPEMQIQKLHK